MDQVIETDRNNVDIIQEGFLPVNGQNHKEDNKSEVEVEEGFRIHD